MIEKIKQRILEYFGIYKVMRMVLDDHEYSLKLRRDVVKLDKYRARIHTLESKMLLLKVQLDNMAQNKYWGSFQHEKYMSDVNNLLNEHKKWLELNGLVKAPTKA